MANVLLGRGQHILAEAPSLQNSATLAGLLAQGVANVYSGEIPVIFSQTTLSTYRIWRFWMPLALLRCSRYVEIQVKLLWSSNQKTIEDPSNQRSKPIKGPSNGRSSNRKSSNWKPISLVRMPFSIWGSALTSCFCKCWGRNQLWQETTKRANWIKSLSFVPN